MPAWRAFLGGFCLLSLAACSGGGDTSGRSTADFDGIVERGTLRVLVRHERDGYLPRRGDPLLHERELARAFAARHELDVEFVALDTFSTLLPALAEGRGDLVAANLTVTPSRQERFAFSAPLDRSRETLVLAAGVDAPTTADRLRGRLGVLAGSSFVTTARSLADDQSALELVLYDGGLGSEALLDSVAAGALDYTIEDSNRLEVFLQYRRRIQAGPHLGPDRPLAWAVREDNPELLARLDAFLFEERLLAPDDAAYVEDLPALRERRKIRMLTRNNAATYFLWRGEIMGFEYDLARKFAEDLGLRLEVIVAPSHRELLPMLRAGEGDFAAAFLTITDERRDQGVRFSRPYHYASEVVVARTDEPGLEGVDELAGRSIAVRPSSSYHASLVALRDERGIEFELVEAPEDLETEDIIAGVADGRWDLTVADSHILELEMTIRDDVHGVLQLGDPVAHGWAVHPENPELLQALDDFIARHYRGLFYNVVYRKYFERSDGTRAGPARPGTPGRLSPYDDLVRELALDHDYDWRLIVAQMYQESRFDPTARSWAGARGLMQVLPRTARQLGIADLEDPRQGIEAGLRYLDWVRARFPHDLEPAEHMWFTLAGYNAGHGHVRDARRLAARLGLDPDQWFGHVEQAMLELSRPRYAEQARHGYVRGREPVEYVRSIRERYRAYVDLLERDTGGR